MRATWCLVLWAVGCAVEPAAPDAASCPAAEVPEPFAHWLIRESDGGPVGGSACTFAREPGLTRLECQGEARTERDGGLVLRLNDRSSLTWTGPSALRPALGDRVLVSAVDEWVRGGWFPLWQHRVELRDPDAGVVFQAHRRERAVVPTEEELQAWLGVGRRSTEVACEAVQSVPMCGDWVRVRQLNVLATEPLTPVPFGELVTVTTPTGRWAMRWTSGADRNLSVRVSARCPPLESESAYVFSRVGP